MTKIDDQDPPPLAYATREASSEKPLVLRLTLCTMATVVFAAGTVGLIGSVAMIKDGTAWGWFWLIPAIGMMAGGGMAVDSVWQWRTR